MPKKKEVVIFSSKKGSECCYTLTPGRLGEFVEVFFPVRIEPKMTPAVFQHRRGRLLPALVKEPVADTFYNV